MLVQPDTIVRLIKNCPLDRNYQHTIFFDGACGVHSDLVNNGKRHQINYFMSLEGINLTKQSYQRHSKNTISITQKINDIYSYNYMMFKNSSFENKWFFAFITDIEYINNNTSRVEYELDIVQTWLFDFELQNCFVEREHSILDYAGYNLVDEDVSIGKYVYKIRDSIPGHLPFDGIEDMHLFCDDNDMLMSALTIVFVVNGSHLKLDESIYSDLVNPSGIYSGVYQGLDFICYNITLDTYDKIKEFIKNTEILTSGAILSAFIMPTMFVPTPTGVQNTPYYAINKTVTNKVKIPTKIGSYTPVNKKLLTYPYNCAYLTNHRGDYVDVMFERCAPSLDGTVEFCASGNFGTNPGVIAYPKNYLGIEHNIEQSVSITQYPVCTWGTSGFTEWVSNNLMSGLVSSIGSVAKTASNMILPPSSKKAASVGELREFKTTNAASNGAIDFLVSGITSVTQPGVVTGCGASDLVFGVPSIGKTINVYYKQITEEYAKIIDNYFTIRGYACKQVKTPNIESRPVFNYVKTVGCYITGKLPNTVRDKICSIFDSGITFWKRGSLIGNYGYNNSPGSEDSYPDYDNGEV